MSWISAEDAARLLRQQAEATAKQLGHDLQPWREQTMVDGLFSLCNLCGQRAFIAARSFGRPPLAGTALTFRCPPPDPSLVRKYIRIGIA